jgi:hypothetical protein
MRVPFETHSPLSPRLNLNRRRWLNTGLASTVALSQAFNVGCSSEVERTFEYLQDVKLNDGKIITLRFKVVLLAKGKDTDRYERLVKVEMWYDALGIYYLDEPWGNNKAHRLMSFDIVNGIPMLVQDANDFDLITRRNRNRCKQNYFKWLANNWVEVAESEFPGNIVRYNLGRNTWERGDSKIIQKRELSSPSERERMPESIFEYSRGVGDCTRTYPPEQQNQDKEITK